MARPRFFVQHFIACRNAVWDAPPAATVTRTLEQVGYIYRVPPGTEAPEFEEFWLYARLVLTNGVAGFHNFSIEVARLSGTTDQTAFATHHCGRVAFRPANPVVSTAWVFRPLQFPSTGNYEFRLVWERKTVVGPRPTVVAREFIRIEDGP